MSKRRLIVAALLASTLAGGYVAYRHLGWSSFQGSVTALGVDLTQPDALVITQRLADLPRDLVRIPLLKDVLREDALFYYEEHPDTLGVKGALRRITYEHDLEWRDQLLQAVTSEPADIALWRAKDGSLKHFVLSMKRNSVAKLAQELATVGLKDSRLQEAGTIRVDGDKVPLLVMDYGNEQQVLFASRGDRVVFLSHPGMLLQSASSLSKEGKRDLNPGSEQVIAALLSDSASRHDLFRQHFQITPGKAQHSIAVKTHFLSFGYQHFFPAFEALRFDFGPQGWSTQVLLNGDKLPADALKSAPLLSQAPIGPALCSGLPVSWTEAKPVLAKSPLKDEPTIQAFLAEFKGPAAVCWYRQSHLHTPLFMVDMKGQNADTTKRLQTLFDWAIAAPGTTPEPATESRGEQGVRFSRAVTVPKGPGALGMPGASYKPTLLLQDGVAVFSPDHRLVDLAASSLNKRYPSLADVLAPEGWTIAVLTPGSLGDLLKQETEAALPRKNEPLFRDLANRQLMPRYAALKQYPPYQLVLRKPASTGRQWQAVEWRELPMPK